MRVKQARTRRSDAMKLRRAESHLALILMGYSGMWTLAAHIFVMFGIFDIVSLLYLGVAVLLSTVMPVGLIELGAGGGSSPSWRPAASSPVR